jgi:hypothetical protein
LPSSAFAPGAKLDRLRVGRGFVSWLFNCGWCSADFFEDIEDLGKAMMNKSPPNLNWQISSNDVYLAVSHYIFGCI